MHGKPEPRPSAAFLTGGGEMGEIMRAHDWSATLLGEPSTWPQSLRSALSMCLDLPLVSAVLWGPDDRLLYNDAYATLLADRHPWALGRPILDVWAEIADLLSPQLAEVRRTGRGFAIEDQALVLERSDGPAETHWVYSFAPIRGEDGAVSGIFNTATETTLRVLAERARQEGERRLKEAAAATGLSADFRTLFEASPTPFLVVAPPDWTIVAANDARLRVTGTTREGQIGRRLFDVFPDDPGDPSADGVRNLTASLERVVATRAADAMAVQRYAVREPDGRFVERWWSPLNTPVLDKDGEVALIIHRVEDVTEVVRLRGEAEARDQLARDQQAVIDRLRTSEAALRESEARYRTLFENIDAAFCVIEVIFDEDSRPIDHRFVEINPAFERQSGLTDALGRRAREILPDHEQHWFDTYGRLVETGGSIRFENGSDALGRWFDVHAMRVGSPDQRRVAILFNDISARKAAEDRLRELNETLEQRVAERTAELSESQRRFQGIFDSALQFMALLTPDGTVVEVNRTALAWSQIEPSDIVGKPFWLAAPMRGNPELQAAVEAGIHSAAAGETVRAEHEMQGAGEVRAIVDFSLKPVPGEDGKPIWLVAEGRDVTELKSTQEALRQSQKLEAVGQLTGGVAHDFNNLLTIIKSSTDLLRRPDLAEERRRRYVDAISDTVDRAAKLTGQLLAFARRQALKPEVFDVPERVRAITDMLRTVVGSRIHIVTEISNESCFVEADVSQFETALVNMAVNARDAMDGEGMLTVAVRELARIPPLRGHAAASGPFIAVTVADTGTGIAPDKLAQIFEPFYTTKEVGKGTGLGLSQVYGFVKQSGGDVAVESQVGQGAAFTIYLPRVDEVLGRQSARSRDPGVSAEGRGRRVLVVEDNVDVGRFSTQLLQDLGYVTTWAENAGKALELLEKADRFDVVFSDVVMPGMSGVELGQEIRRRHPGLPVVLTSGYSHVLAEDGRHGFEILHKPYAAEELSRVLRRATAGAAAA